MGEPNDSYTPKTIYLHWDGIHTTWCKDAIDEADDVEYIRVDVRDGIVAELVAACKLAMQRYRNDCASFPAHCVCCTLGNQYCAAQALLAAIAKVEGKEEKDAQSNNS